MNGEALSNDTGEKQEETGFQSMMAEMGVFDAEAARERVDQAKKDKAEAEAAAKRAEEEERERRNREYEERVAAERAEAEQRKREHDLAWEKQQEEFDYPREIFGAFIPGINEMIEKASDDGQESIDLTKSVYVYDPHPFRYDGDHEGVASLLTGKELGSWYSKNSQGRECKSMIDGVFEKESGRDEFRKEILTMADELMPKLAELYEQKGFRAQLDEHGILTSIAWGEEPEPQPASKESGFIDRFIARFRA